MAVWWDMTRVSGKRFGHGGSIAATGMLSILVRMYEQHRSQLPRAEVPTASN
jgi:hypothetical protein